MVDDSYKWFIQQTPTNLLMYKANFPEFTLVEGSNIHFKALGIKREDIIGKPLIEAFPEGDNSWNFDSIERLITSFRKVMETGRPDRMPVVRYDIPNGDGKVEVTYWSSDNFPIFDENGNIQYIMNKCLDVSRLMT